MSVPREGILNLSTNIGINETKEAKTIDGRLPNNIFTEADENRIKMQNETISKNSATFMSLPVRKRIPLRIKVYTIDNRSFSGVTFVPPIIAFS